MVEAFSPTSLVMHGSTDVCHSTDTDHLARHHAKVVKVVRNSEIKLRTLF